MAEEKKEKEEGEGKEAPSGPKMIMGFPLPIFALFAANALVMLGGLGFIIHASLIYEKPPITEPQVQAEIVKKNPPKEEPAAGIFIENYSETTINLRSQQGGKNHYVTLEASILCNTEVCLAQVKSLKAKIEDAIRVSVSGRSYTELQSLDVKHRIKHEILNRVNSFLKETAATEVYFTQFIVQ